MIAHHAPDVDAIPSSNPAVHAYVAEAERLGATGPTPKRVLSYGPDRGQRLDVYAPANASGLPVLLFFHGGAWISGHLGWLRFMALPALANGFVFVAATYRLAPRWRWPAQLDDAHASLALIEKEVRGSIILGGHSAGGHLATLTALSHDVPCLPVSAPMSLEHGGVPPDSDAGRVYKYLLGAREQDREASPLRHAGRNAAPFHLLWGERDIDYVARSNVEMADRLGASRTVLPGASHFDTHLSLADPASPWWAHAKGMA